MSHASGITLARPKVVLLDIEGTVCPISFVKDVLFPYALHALPTVASSQWDDSTFQRYVTAFPESAQENPSALCACVEQLTRDDVKVSYLKDLQGYLWRSGYESGAFTSPLFDDVVPVLQSWHGQGVALAIYSSGSVAAQKLLLQYVSSPTTPTPPSDSGTHARGKAQDIRPLFNDHYFDTVNAGSKLHSSSYIKIAELLAVEPREVLFFSDNLGETRAATSAGMEAVVVRRQGNAEISVEDEENWKATMVWDFREVSFA